MRKRRHIQSRTNYAVVVDGETEVWYLQMLRRNEKLLNVTIEPKIPQKKTLSEQYKKVLSLANNYTNVFWIVDLDVVLKETRETRRGAETPLQLFGKLRRKLAKENQNVVVIVNNPCIEFWFLLHFGKTSKYYRSGTEAEKRLKNFLPDYQKTQRYFTKQGQDIYLQLKPHLLTAVTNSSLLDRFNINAPERAYCEMDLFFHSKNFGGYFCK